MNRGDPAAPQTLCDIDRVHYCFVYVHYETYLAKWVVGWWEIIRRPRKVWVTTELAGCNSLSSHCFSTPSVFLMKKRRTIFAVLHICIWTTDFLLFLHILPEMKRKKKNFGGLRPTCRPHLHSCGPMCCIWHASWARECVWQLRRVAFDSFTSVTR